MVKSNLIVDESQERFVLVVQRRHSCKSDPGGRFGGHSRGARVEGRSSGDLVAPWQRFL